MRTFVVLEGPDKIGKTTLSCALEKQLKEQGVKCRRFREPGGIRESEYIRDTIMKCEDNISPRSQLLLFMASRNNLLDYIFNNVPEDEIIILDRFVLSSIVYQKSIEDTMKIYEVITKGRDMRLINILLDASDEFLEKRTNKNYDKSDINFLDSHTGIAEQYRKIYQLDRSIVTKTFPGAIEKVIIDSDDIDINLQKILKLLFEYNIPRNEKYEDLMKVVINNNLSKDMVKEYNCEMLETFVNTYNAMNSKRG